MPEPVVTFLRDHREEVFAHLGGSAADEPSRVLLQQLGVELVYCTDDATAEAAVAEILTDAGARAIGIDIETTPQARVRRSGAAQDDSARPTDAGAAEV